MSNMRQVMLTTIDNPHDPFTNYDAWNSFDVAKGYHTPGLIARIAHLSSEMSPTDEAEAIELVVDQIVQDNVGGIYKKVVKDI